MQYLRKLGALLFCSPNSSSNKQSFLIYQFSRSSMMKHHKLSGLKKQSLFTNYPIGNNPTSEFLVRILSLVCRCLLLSKPSCDLSLCAHITCVIISSSKDGKNAIVFMLRPSHMTQFYLDYLYKSLFSNSYIKRYQDLEPQHI